jgi:hypothetical protein
MHEFKVVSCELASTLEVELNKLYELGYQLLAAPFGFTVTALNNGVRFTAIWVK